VWVNTLGINHQFRLLLVALAAASLVALASAAPSHAADPSQVVQAALLTTDDAVDSGRFTATVSERGFSGSRRVISHNTMVDTFNLSDPSRLSEDFQIVIPAGNLNLRFVALKGVNYYRSGGITYKIPLTAKLWKRQFARPHAKNLAALVNKSLGSLGDWRDEGPGISDGVAIENYSAVVDFPTLTSSLLTDLSTIVHDAQFDLHMSDAKKWQDANSVNGQLPRVTFGIDGSNVLRRLHVEAPSASIAQGYEYEGDFELTDIGESVPVQKLPHAHKVTAKNVAKFFKTIFGTDVPG
jgi:hypothetical protein